MIDVAPEMRDIAAKVFDTNSETYRNGRSAGDLVRAVASAEMFSYPLPFGSNRDGQINNAPENESKTMCLNWRFLVHAEGYPRGLQFVHGGLTHKDWDEEGMVMAPLEIEMSFDHVIDASADSTVTNILDYVGDEILEKSYNNDRPFFACLEHRYTSDGRGWPQLIYPIELTKTIEAVQRQNAHKLKQGYRPSKWMERAAKSGARNRMRVANAMALSAFWRTRQMDQADTI